LSGRQDRLMVAKKCRAFKAERHRDENEVMILGACVVQVRGWGCLWWVRLRREEEDGRCFHPRGRLFVIGGVFDRTRAI
jgi:hypothetical protein